MAVETELKLRIAPEHMVRLKRHALLKTLESEPAVTRKLRNIYFDTPGLDLHRHQMALRLRRAGGKWLQTLKGGGGVEAGLHSRNEWEAAAAGEALDLEALKAAGGKLPSGVKKKLRPVFSTDFSRTLRELKFEGAAIELCMDSGAISAGKKSRPISELELELKTGRPQQLFKLALALLEIVPLEVEHASKAEYGYLLCAGGKPEASKVRLPRLAPTDGIDSALRNMISACLLHVQANVPGAIAQLDEEYLHQVRVGLRRLRVVLTMAHTYRQDAELGELRLLVGDLCVQLGRARDWDVFVSQTLAPVCAQFPDHTGLRAMLRVSQKNRKLQGAAMRASLASQEFSRLLLRLGCWMQGDYWREMQMEGANLADFSRRMLNKRSKRVLRIGKQVAHGDAGQLHALRIACKKLRYGAEMFGLLHGLAETGRYIDALSRLQDTLGMLNDIAVARSLLEGMDTKRETGSASRDLVLGWLEHRYAQHMAELKKGWKRYFRQDAFW